MLSFHGPVLMPLASPSPAPAAQVWRRNGRASRFGCRLKSSNRQIPSLVVIVSEGAVVDPPLESPNPRN